jgi:AraC-like DNA-binding protein
MVYIKIDDYTCLRRLGRYSQSVGWDHTGKRINSNLLVVLESGDCSFSLDGKTYALNVGDAILIPKGVWYSPNTVRGCSYRYFQFLGEVCDESDGMRAISDSSLAYQYSDTLPKERTVLALPEKIETDRLTLSYLDMVMDSMLSDSPESKLRMNLCFILALSSLSERARVGGQDLPDRIKTYISDNKLCELTLSDIAEHFGYTKQHIVRVFSAKFDMSPVSYIEKLRLSYSLALLSDGADPITEVARKSGFPDANYFSRRFKKCFGISPRGYRSSSRESAFRALYGDTL